MERVTGSGRSGEPDERTSEVELAGGTSNNGLVVRVGNTVRRPQTAASPAIHALLRHLERVGFDGAPRLLGTDDEGREVLSFVPGDAATRPYPPWALTDAALTSVADLLRRYHEAVRGFDPTPHRWGSTVPAAFRTTLVSHNDPNLDNVVFRDGEAVALIDFDLASPGSALWDVALAARLWVPLRDPRDVDDERATRMHERLRLFVAAYGLPEADRRRVATAVVQTHGWSYDIVHVGASRGQPGYVGYWTAVARAHDLRGRQWLAENLRQLDASLAR
jgi:Phosphotransferase enzyme family